MEPHLRIVYLILRKIAVNQERPITYTELSNRYRDQSPTNHSVDPQFGWSDPLGHVVTWCHNHTPTLPPLPALVVNAEGPMRGLPGMGFWDHPNIQQKPSEEAWVPMCRAVYAANWPEEME
jgi:hypothetical protein